MLRASLAFGDNTPLVALAPSRRFLLEWASLRKKKKYWFFKRTHLSSPLIQDRHSGLPAPFAFPPVAVSSREIKEHHFYSLVAAVSDNYLRAQCQRIHLLFANVINLEI